MRSKSRLYLLVVVCLLVTTCTSNPAPEPHQTPAETSTASPTPRADILLTPTTTPTPTPSPASQKPATPTAAPPGACVGLNGYLEVQLLIGPSDAVGLEPLVVGQLPFAATGNSSPYPLTGVTTLSYQDTLSAEWGSFDVQFDADMTVEGFCLDAGQAASLEITVTMDGEQLVTVTSEGFTAEYPWTGTQTREFVMPVETGAVAQGEGWAFTLYLN